ncbi:AEC family transporter [Marinomonas epiphytica]
MEVVFNITAPIFLLILLGFISVRFSLLSSEALPLLSRFVIYLSLPSLIFTKLSSLDFKQLVNGEFVFVYAFGALLSFFLTTVICRFSFAINWSKAGVRGVGGSMCNSAFIGLPILIQSFEHPPTQAFAMALMVENIILLPIFLIFIESTNRDLHESSNYWHIMKTVGGRISSNPLLLSVGSGVLFSLFGWHLPSFMERGLSILGGAASPTALIIIGGALVGVSIRGELKQIFSVAALKLLVFPVIAMGLLLLTPDLHDDLKLAVIILAAMPMFTSYPIIFGEYGERAFCASSLLVTTVLSFFTLSALLLFWL